MYTDVNFKEFFPTPPDVIKKMVDGFDFKNLTILEPSAGNGCILDEISYKIPGYFRSKPKNLYCIEPNEDLRAVLTKKGYNLIGHDFFNYNGSMAIDLIIMNPPFSNGDDHLLHAWDTLDSGEIVCLLNKETILNPFSASRQLLRKIIEDNGSYTDLGNCFANASRKTNVEVVMVKLKKNNSRRRFDFKFSSAEHENTMDFTDFVQDNELKEEDRINDFLRAFNKAQQSMANFIKAEKEMHFFGNIFLKNTSSVLNIINNDETDPKLRYNKACNLLKNQAWATIISKLDMDRLMTYSVRENFQKFVQEQGASDLCKENIISLIKMLCSNSRNIMNQAVVDVFDLFTKYHEENRCHVEGWKTNSAWKANRKIILPYFVEAGYSGNYRYSYRKYSEYSDIDKVMAYLSGDKFEEIEKLEKTIQAVRYGDSGWHEGHYFNIRCFKKGTLHLYFKSEDLWARFNMVACEGKNWIGAGK